MLGKEPEGNEVTLTITRPMTVQRVGFVLHNVPEWVRYITVDSTGEVWYWTHKPKWGGSHRAWYADIGWSAHVLNLDGGVTNSEDLFIDISQRREIGAKRGDGGQA